MSFSLAVLIGAMELGGIAEADALFPHCTTDLRAFDTQPTNTPILITVTITNRGESPIPYGIAGGSYPNAGLFKARIIDSQGQVQEQSLHNEQDAPGSRWHRELKRGDSINMPAMIDPLPLGSFTIRVRDGKSAKVAVKDDRQVAQKWDEELLAKIRKGDPFANHVAYVILRDRLARPFFIDGLLRDLSSDNQMEAERAAFTLNRAPALPAKAGAIITQTMRKQLALVRQQGFSKTSILTPLAAMAAQVGTDEALEAVVNLAQTKEVRGSSIWALGGFKQEKALKELRLFLTDQDEELQFRAAQRLSERKDPEALKVLLTVAHDPKSRWRMYSFDALLKYPDDPRFEPAIKSGLQDTDSQVRQSAEFALRQLANQKKKKP